MKKILLSTTLSLGLLFANSNKSYPNTEFSSEIFLDAATTGSSSSAEIRRARVKLDGDIIKDLSYKLEYSLTNGGEFKDLYIRYNIDQINSSIKIGNIKEPFSLEDLSGAKYHTFMERSLLKIFKPDRKVGVSLNYHNKYDKDNAFTFSTGAFSQSINNYNSNKNRYSIASRATYAKLINSSQYFFHIGSSFEYSKLDSSKIKLSSRPESHMASKYLKEKIKNVDSDLKIGVETIYQYYNDRFQAEMIFDTIKTDLGKEYKIDGWYMEFSHLFGESYKSYKVKKATVSKIKNIQKFDFKKSYGTFEGAFRVSNLNIDDLKTLDKNFLNYTIGLNWYPNKDARVMANYIITDFNSDRADSKNILQLRVQYAF